MASRRVSRRKVISGALAAGALAAAGLGTLGLRPALASRLIGERDGRRLRTLSDGHLTQPVSFMFPDIPESEVAALLEANGIAPGPFQPECNVTLYEDGERLVLFDAGSGSNFLPTAGELPAALEEAGIDPEAVTDVVFTHGHPDHLWGITDDFDEIAFAKARLHFPRAEWDFWRDPDTVNRMGEARQAFAVGAQNRLAIMEERVELFDPGAEILPGIEAFTTPGHTPGHTAFVVHGAGEPVMVIGDALTNAVISFGRPDWPTGADQDPQVAIATRKALLDRITSEAIAIIGFHLPDGGFGRAEKDGTAYRFVGA